nr:GDSL esterase/lipase [Tanacetum cinerariifolium]
KDLGFKDFIPPYATVKRQDVLKGVNYASAGSGILDESGENVVIQLPSFLSAYLCSSSCNNNALKTGAKANYLPYGIDFPQGPTGRFSNGLNAADFVAKDLGFKDFIPPYATVKRQDVLRGVNYASAGSGILDESGENVWLYKLGARKLCISGSGQIGCVPAEKRLFGTRIACVKEINDALIIFNAKILSLLVDLNINLEDAKFVYHDLNNPTSGLPQFDGMWRET